MDEPHIDSVNPKSNSAAPTAETQGNPDFVSEIPPSVKHKTERAYTKPDPTPLWKIILEVGAVAVGIAVACIYYRQLQVMRGQLGEIIKQYPEIKKSANAAIKAADQTELAVTNAADNFRADQRAWIGTDTVVRPVNPQQFPYPTMFFYRYKNYGRSPAIDVLAHDGAHIYGEHFPSSPFYFKQLPSPEFFSKMTVFPGQEIDLDGTAYVCQLHIPEIRAGKKWCYTYGFISYKDEFGGKHVTHFCYRHGINPLGQSTALCDTYNDAN